MMVSISSIDGKLDDRYTNNTDATKSGLDLRSIYSGVSSNDSQKEMVDNDGGTGKKVMSTRERFHNYFRNETTLHGLNHAANTDHRFIRQ